MRGTRDMSRQGMRDVGRGTRDGGPAAMISIAHVEEVSSGTSPCCRGPCINVLAAAMLQAPSFTIKEAHIAGLIKQLAAVL
jgi:hypothetical protein